LLSRGESSSGNTHVILAIVYTVMSETSEDDVKVICNL